MFSTPFGCSCAWTSVENTLIPVGPGGPLERAARALQPSRDLDRVECEKVGENEEREDS